MIFGVGVDIVEVSRVEASYARWGDKFCRKILSEVEQTELKTSRSKPRFIAKRFCVKEALSKAIGTGMKSGVYFPQFEVKHHKSGAPYVLLTGRVQKIFADKLISDIHISISDERAYVVAFAVLSTRHEGNH